LAPAQTLILNPAPAPDRT